MNDAHKNKKGDAEALYPMRINKYLAQKGYSTRRGADDLIEKGVVFVNDKKAVLGGKVIAEDVVEVRRTRKTNYVYLAYNKPVGVITHSPGADEIDIQTSLAAHTTLPKYTPSLFPVGRLDKASSGLIILTNDGRITDRLLNPQNSHDKEYVVTVNKPITEHFQNKMKNGVLIEGYKTAPAKIVVLSPKKCALTLIEGKKHQIRRMCTALGYEVVALTRTRIMNITLGSLGPNEYKELTGVTLSTFLKNIHL